MGERKAATEARQAGSVSTRRSGAPGFKGAPATFVPSPAAWPRNRRPCRGIDPLCRHEFENALSDAALLVPQLKAAVGHVILGQGRAFDDEFLDAL